MPLVRTFGDPEGRLSSAVMLAVPSAVSPTEAFVVSGGLERRRRWHRVDVGTGTELETHDLRTETAHPVDITGDGTRVALAGGPLRIRAHTGDLLWRRRGGWGTARFVDGDTRLLAWSDNGDVAEFDAATGEELYRIRGYGPAAVKGRYLALNLDRHHAGLLDRTTGQVVARWPGTAAALVPWNGGLLGALYFLAPGVRRPVWRVPTVPSGQLILGADTVLVVGADIAYEHSLADPTVRTEVRVPSGTRRFTATGDRAVAWRGNAYWGWTRAGGEVGRTDNHESPVETVVSSPDGTLTASFAYDRTIRIWAHTTAAPVRTIDLDHGSNVVTLDNTAVTAGRRSPPHRWSCGTGAPLPQDHPFPPSVDHWQYSPDGTELWCVERTPGRWLRGSLTRLADRAVLWSGEVTAQPAGFGPTGVVVLTAQGLLQVYGLPVPLAHRGSQDLPAFDPTATLLARYPAWSTVVVNDTRTGAELGRADLTTANTPVFAGPDHLVVLDRAARVHVLATPGLEPLDVLTPPDAYSIHAGPNGTLDVGTSRGTILRYAFN